MGRFYRTLAETRNLRKASRTLEPEFALFHCESFFYVVFIRTYRDHCLGQGGQQALENLFTRATHEGWIQSSERLRELRKVFKKALKRPEEAFRTMSRRFLHGKRLKDYEKAVELGRSVGVRRG